MKIKLVEFKKRTIPPKLTIVNDLTVKNSHSYCVGIKNMVVHNCLTTKQSGVGFPMASLIHETYMVKKHMIDTKATVKWNGELKPLKQIKKYPKIIADGGMKDYSDVIKAFALGADGVMIGSIFNKSLESCADNYFHGIKLNYRIANFLFNRGYIIKKQFRGMSTKEAQKAMGKQTFTTSEGVVRIRRVEYHLSGWMHNLQHYLRNAMSYANCYELSDFIGVNDIIQISSKAHERFNK